MINEILKAEKYWLILSLTIALGIFIQSNFPSAVTTRQFYALQIDKVTHLLAWTSLSFSLRLGTNSWIMKYKDRKLYFSLLVLIIVCSLYGLLDEIHQYFIPSRSTDIMDVLADTIGSIIGVMIAHIVVIKKTRKIFS